VGGLLRMMAPLNRALDLFAQIVTSCSLLAIVAVNAMEIVARALFEHSFTWVQDTNLLLASCVYFIGISMVYFKNHDIVVNLIQERLSAPLRRIVLAIIKIAGIVTVWTTAYFGLELVQLQFPFRTPTSGIPNALYTAPLVLGTILMGLSLIQQLIMVMSGANESGQDDHEDRS
jgi:TRAP-type C4-dicarboxylate transport system permease small subunit